MNNKTEGRNKPKLGAMNRNILAWFTLLICTGAISVLALFIINNDSLDAKDIFYAILPVFSSWVGTVLAFYFSRESFESANRQVWELVERLTPEQRAKASVRSIMRPFGDITYFPLSSEQNIQTVKLADLYSLLGGNISRLAIIDAELKPKYIIHQSRLDNYLALDGKKEDNLATFIAKQKSKGSEFGFNQGFVVVSEKTSLAEAKHKMDDIPSCQDIFITKDGSLYEPLTGWISNVRLAKFLVV